MFLLLFAFINIFMCDNVEYLEANEPNTFINLPHNYLVSDYQENILPSHNYQHPQVCNSIHSFDKNMCQVNNQYTDYPSIIRYQATPEDFQNEHINYEMLTHTPKHNDYITSLKFEPKNSYHCPSFQFQKDKSLFSQQAEFPNQETHLQNEVNKTYVSPVQNINNTESSIKYMPQHEIASYELKPPIEYTSFQNNATAFSNDTVLPSKQNTFIQYPGSSTVSGNVENSSGSANEVSFLPNISYGQSITSPLSTIPYQSNGIVLSNDTFENPSQATSDTTSQSMGQTSLLNSQNSEEEKNQKSKEESKNDKSSKNKESDKKDKKKDKKSKNSTSKPKSSKSSRNNVQTIFTSIGVLMMLLSSFM